MQQHALLQLYVARRGRGELLLQVLTCGLPAMAAFGFFDGIGQVFYRHRLEYKIHHMILDGTLRVGKIRIAGQNDDFDAGMVAGDDLGKLKTVHTGHADITDNDIRLNDRNLLERHHTVVCLCGNHSRGRPSGCSVPDPLRMADSLSTIITFSIGLSPFRAVR